MEERKNIKIKIKINVSPEELMDFKPETANISIEGSKLTLTESPNPSADAEGTF